MIATRPMTYRTRRLMAGDRFDVAEIPARLLARNGKARPAAEMPKDNHGHPHDRPPIDGDDLSVLRALAKSLNIAVDGRWGVKRLKTEIAKKR